MLVLAIETSCDDTSVALVEASGYVRAMVSANQDKAHQPFGGVVPEIAGRNHLQDLMPLVDKLWLWLTINLSLAFTTSKATLSPRFSLINLFPRLDFGKTRSSLL